MAKPELNLDPLKALHSLIFWESTPSFFPLTPPTITFLFSWQISLFHSTLKTLVLDSFCTTELTEGIFKTTVAMDPPKDRIRIPRVGILYIPRNVHFKLPQ